MFAGIQRRRRYTADQKMAVVQEAAQPGMTISYVARRHGIAPSLIFGWRRRMSEGGKEAIRADDEVVAKAEILALQKQVRELQRVLGKKTLENEILREAVKARARKKTDLAVAVITGRGYAVKRVAEVLGCVAIAADGAAEGRSEAAIDLPQGRGCRVAGAAALAGR